MGNHEKAPPPNLATEPKKTKKRVGFAAMDPAVVSEIARKGGRAAHAKGTGHSWTVEEAREAGRKGGRARRDGRAAKGAS